jgi:hypothetical protein
VIGFRLRGRLREGTTATDLVLTVTQMLRRRGVVGKFVEFFGPGRDETPSPQMSSPSMITSPRLTPIRKVMRWSSGVSVLRSSIARCSSSAQRTA